MSVNFTIAKKMTAELEGGYWLDPSAGHTYAGIAYRYNRDWSGWRRLFALANARYGGIHRTPRYTIFKDAVLDALIADFYKQKYWLGLLNASMLRNQDIANFLYDFIVHKQYDAIAVINHTVRQLAPHTKSNAFRLTPAVVAVINNNQTRFYNMARRNRLAYYNKPSAIPGTRHKSFSKSMAQAFNERVLRFPVAIQESYSFPIFKLPYV